MTVDLQRDTPQLLKRYAEAFGPEFIGLRTDDPALGQLAKRYRVTYSLGKPVPTATTKPPTAARPSSSTTRARRG